MSGQVIRVLVIVVEGAAVSRRCIAAAQDHGLGWLPWKLRGGGMRDRRGPDKSRPRARGAEARRRHRSQGAEGAELVADLFHERLSHSLAGVTHGRGSPMVPSC